MFSNTFHNGYERFSQFSYVCNISLVHSIQFAFFVKQYSLLSPPLPSPLHHPRSPCPVVLIVVVPTAVVVVTIVAHAPMLFKSDVSFVEVDAGPCPLVPYLVYRTVTLFVGAAALRSANGVVRSDTPLPNSTLVSFRHIDSIHTPARWRRNLNDIPVRLVPSFSSSSFLPL